MELIVTVIYSNCAITYELNLVSTALACASPSRSWLCVYIPCTIVCMSFIASWCYSVGEGGIPYMFLIATVYPHFPMVVIALLYSQCSWQRKQIVVCPRLLVGGLTYPISYVVIKKTRMCQKCNPFGHHHVVGYCLPYCSREFSLLFQFFLSIGQGVPQSLRDPSPSLNSPRGRFRLSLYSFRKGVEVWWVRTLVRNLLAGPPVGIGILVPPPLRSGIRPRRCIFETVLGFVETFQFWTLVLGILPCSVGSCQGCAAAQVKIPSMSCNPRMS